MSTITRALIDTPAERSLGAARDPERARARERRRALARTLRRGVLAAALAGAAVLTVLALRPRPVPVDVAKAALGPLEVAIEESGTTRVKDRYVVSAPASGSVSRIPLEPGDAVEEGDVLAVIVPALSPLLDERTRAESEGRLSATLSSLGQARSQASRAAAASQLAEQELARERRLAEAGAVSPTALEQAEFAARMRAQELASAEFATKVASEEVRIARAALARDGQGDHRGRHVDVLAPVSGRVLRVQQKSEGVVQAGTVLVEVGDPGALEVVVDLLTTDATRVEPGTPAVIEGWGHDTPLAGRVRRIEPSAFKRLSALGVDEQRVNVIVALTDPREKWASLADGYGVEVRIVVWRGESVLKVPQGAVFRNGAAWAVFRVEDRVAHLTPVELGHRGEIEVEIVSGLTPGAEVAVHPSDRVKEGARVDVR